MKAHQFFRQSACDPEPPGDMVAHVAQQRKLQAVRLPGKERPIRQLRGHREQPRSSRMEACQDALIPAQMKRAKWTPAAAIEDKDNRPGFQFCIKANLPATRIRKDEIGGLLTHAAHPFGHNMMSNGADKSIQGFQRLRRDLHFRKKIPSRFGLTGGGAIQRGLFLGPIFLLQFVFHENSKPQIY